MFQSDLAKEFVAEVVKELIAVLGAKFRHSPYHPQTNTHVERYNKTLATNLSLLLERKDQKDWDEYLGEVEYAQLQACWSSESAGGIFAAVSQRRMGCTGPNRQGDGDEE